MKRSKFIDIDKQRASTRQRALTKQGALTRQGSAAHTFVAPVALILTAATSVACTKEEEVKIVATVEECVERGNLSQKECETAYMKAVAEAERTGPRYGSRSSCESEFGYSRCRRGSGGMFMPMMAGFMIGRMMGGRGMYNPVYQYSGYNSRLNGQYMTAGGSAIGRPGQSSYKVDSASMKRQPRSTRTVSRGGFGSVSSAKSSWGGGRRSRSWGG